MEIFHAAVKAVQPSVLLPQHIRIDGDTLWLYQQSFSLSASNIYVIGAGKAAAAMAFETEKILGKHIRDGVIVTKYDHGLPLKKIRCIEAGHPVPDDQSVLAGKAILQLAQQCGENDIVIILISGGASALMADVPPGSGLQEVQYLFGLLLGSGANIDEMNIVRRHLSLIKGGGLSRAAYPATQVSFILSDVIGDPLHVIASGPTVPDPTTFTDAYHVLQQYNLVDKTPLTLINWIRYGLEGKIEDTPKPGNPVFAKTSNHLIGTNLVALEAAAQKARTLGYAPLIITDRLTGESRTAAKAFAESILNDVYTKEKPACLLMGGETTVTINGKGKGGRNQEFALAALITLMDVIPFNKMPLILSAGTDGSDGPTDATGAMVDEETIRIVKESNTDPTAFLESNDSYHFFQRVGGHIITGATQTNVMDIVMALIP